MAKLILVHHRKSEWNKQGLWTGWTDVDLAEEVHEEARVIFLRKKLSFCKT